MHLTDLTRRTLAAGVVAVLGTTLALPAADADNVSAVTPDGTPKNVILMIGDGMGYNYLDLHNAFHTGKVHYQVETGGDHKAISAQTVNSPRPSVGFQSWQQLSMQTHWADGIPYDPQAAWADFQWAKKNPTDSAAAGTAMASGVKTYNAGLGVDVNENVVENVSERAKSLGKAAGVVTTVPFSHATPAAFSAHAISRNDYHGIAAQQVGGEMDVVMGAGHPSYDNNHQLLDSPQYKYISEQDYTTLSSGGTDFEFIEENDDFRALTEGNTPERVFGVAQAASTLQQSRGEDRGPEDRNDLVDLPTMTEGALNVLDEDKDGFFLMVEGGAIDWTGHANQTERALEETDDFFASVESVTRWVEENSSWDETLVIVTADHETGYLSGDPGEAFNPMIPQGVGEYPSLSWNSPNHTNQLVPYFVNGAGAEALAERTIARDQIRGRYLDNTALAEWLLTEQWVPGEEPTAEPTEAPTGEPTGEPTEQPTEQPTGEPTGEPTEQPTDDPTAEPTSEPSEESTADPTGEPTGESSADSTAEPTSEPTGAQPGNGSSKTPVLGDGHQGGQNQGSNQGAGTSSGGKLAHTGANVSGLLLGGLGLLLLGGVGLLIARRTRGARSSG